MISLLALLVATAVDAGESRRSTARVNEVKNRLGIRETTVPGLTGPRGRMLWALDRWPAANVPDLMFVMGALGVDRMSTVPTPVDGMIPWAIMHFAKGGATPRQPWLERLPWIRDWYTAEHPDIWRFTPESAIEASDEFHRRLEQSVYDDEVEDGATQVVHRFDDGWTIVHMLDKAALEFESSRMGHCIGTSDVYINRLESGDGVHLSLRDPSGRPHVTMAFVRDSFGWKWMLVEAKAKGNSIVPRRYADRILAWMELGPVVTSSRGISWEINSVPTLYDASADYLMLLPDHVLEENLDTRRFEWARLRSVMSALVADRALTLASGLGFGVGERQASIRTVLVELDAPITEEEVAYSTRGGGLFDARGEQGTVSAAEISRHVWFRARNVEFECWVHSKTMSMPEPYVALVLAASTRCVIGFERLASGEPDFAGRYRLRTASAVLVEVSDAVNVPGGTIQRMAEGIAARLRGFSGEIRSKSPLSLERATAIMNGRERRRPFFVPVDSIGGPTVLAIRDVLFAK